MTTKEIYLDNAATTRPWPEVVAAMGRVMTEGFGNASSLHRRGLAASREVRRAEEAISRLVGGGPWRVLFTSGGTEADTLAILGTVPRGKRDAVVASALEHAAVAAACREVERRGGRYRSVSAGVSGVVSPEEMAAAVDERTALVSCTQVAGELGTVQPAGAVAAQVKHRSARCRVHVDAVQAAPQLARLDLPPEVDMVSLSSHKIHGPQGVGALLVRPEVRPRPLLFGGDQQGGVRPGTLNLPGIVGFGVAADLMVTRRDEGIPRMRARCDELVRGIIDEVPRARLLGDPAARAPGMAVIAFGGGRSEVLLHALEARGLLAASGAACHATRTRPPRSMVDAGLEHDEGAVRFSLSLDSKDTDMKDAIGIVRSAVDAVRSGTAGAP